MDCQYDSDSEEDSFVLDVEDGNALFMYNCNDVRSSPQNNHVTRIFVRSGEPNPSFDNVVYLTNDTTSTDGVSNKFKQPCKVQFEEPFHNDPLSEESEKPYQELEEALSVLDAAACNLKMSSQSSNNSTNPESVQMTTNCTYSGVSNNDLAPHLAETSDVITPPDLIDTSTRSHSEIIRTQAFAKPFEECQDTKTPPLPPPPPAFVNQAETCTNSSQVVTPSDSYGMMSSKTNQLDSNGTDVTEKSSVFGIEEKNHIFSQDLLEHISPPHLDLSAISDNTASCSQKGIIATNNSTSPNPNSVKLPSSVADGNSLSEHLVQATSSTIQPSGSSFHYPEPARPDPVVCVPVKEVKFDEPPKHEVTAKGTVIENHGEVAPITVQSSSTLSQGALGTEDPNSHLAPHTVSQIRPQPKDETTSPSKATHAPLELSESKMSNNRDQDVEVPSNPGGQDQLDHTIGIIGNEDNLSEVTLPPLSDAGAADLDHGSSQVNNGLPRHRIRVSIDQNPPAPSRRAVALTVILVILLILVLTLIVAYKFVLKSTPE